MRNDSWKLDLAVTAGAADVHLAAGQTVAGRVATVHVHVIAVRSGNTPSGPGTPGGPGEPKDPQRAPTEGDDVELEDKPITATPRRYKVLFHNDDYTTMEFVVEVLKRFFHKTDTEAVHIMLTVHKTGAAVAGVYTRDVAETKSTQVMDYARENGMPLLLTTEPE